MSRIEFEVPTKGFNQIKAKVGVIPNHRQTGKKYIAQFDTGSTGTAISKRLQQEMGLIESGKSRVGLLSDEAYKLIEIPDYRIHLLLYDNVILRNVKVSCFDMPEDIDVLVGMDVISKGNFVLKNEKGTTRFYFSIKQ